jgi:hypothetical protein
MKINLPKKDQNGKSRLSYSQIQTFKKSKKLFYKRYILKEPFFSNPYVNFGNKVGRALQHNDFLNFNENEKNVLSAATRLDVFEKFVKLEYTDFNLYGYIDTCSKDYSTLVDYKTGGEKKEEKYMNLEYNQLQIYSLAIRQMYGVTPKNAWVEFIRREGNPYKGSPLCVADEPLILIEADLSLKRLIDVYHDIYKTAVEISDFYRDNHE